MAINTRRHLPLRLFLVLAVFFISTGGHGLSYGWHDETHLAVAKVAGYYKWYNAAGADIAKIKAGSIEGYNHYFNNPGNIAVTADLVLDQVSRYNDPNDRMGHLYGAIIGALREFRKTTSEGKYAEYHMAYLAHYVTDLSQPLHHVPYDEFNKTRHSANDGTVDDEVLGNLYRIRRHTYEIKRGGDDFERDLAVEIARIAAISGKLAEKMKRENRNMTKAEAYVQLGHSASLLRAVLTHLGKTSKTVQAVP
jgi:hypothetical protein